jgi:C_GCAxxG_C_C family probable redox protein
MTRTEKALENFKTFNCCQSALSVFAEELDLDMGTALKISSGFGGGMNKGEVCGVVSGVCMAIGLKYGSSDSENLEAKKNSKESVIKFMEKFMEENGSFTCKGLLGYDKFTEEGAKIVEEKGLTKNLCPEFLKSAIEIAEEII